MMQRRFDLRLPDGRQSTISIVPNSDEATLNVRG